MSTTTAALATKPAYRKALLATAKASPKGPFHFYEGKFADGTKAKLPVFGRTHGELKKHLEAQKAALLDEGTIGPGAEFAGKRGKLDAKALLTVQAYLTALKTQAVKVALGTEYDRMLRHQHAELGKLHH